MAPKRKRNAKGKVKRRKKQASKMAVAVARPESEPGVTIVPTEILRQIFRLLDIVTATTFGLACKTFREIYTAAFEAQFRRPPTPAIKLLTEVQLEDKTSLALYTSFQTWMGPGRSWNPFAGKWHDRQQMLEWSQQMTAEVKEAREEKAERRDTAQAEREVRKESEAEDREIAREKQRAGQRMPPRLLRDKHGTFIQLLLRSNFLTLSAGAWMNALRRS